MKRAISYFMLAVLSAVAGTAVSAQEFEWKLGFDGFFDNREYYDGSFPPDSQLRESQTFFGNRLKGELGGSINQQHRLRAGIDYIYEYGGPVNAKQPDMIMYYQYFRQPYTVYMGVFPRRDLLDYPLALLNDTLNYYRPNIMGIYLRQSGSWGYQNVFIDWTSRQTETDYERFMLGFSGRFNLSPFFISHYFLLGHFAGTAIWDPDFHLRDNGGVNINVGLDLSGKSGLDTLTLSAGALVSLDKIRGVDDGFQTPAGLLVQAEAVYRFAGIRTNIYLGEGHTFLYGDVFYRERLYGRADLFVIPFRSEYIRSRLSFNFHFVEGNLDYSQQILLSIDLDRDIFRAD